jgi:hypothetical protein
MDRTRFCVAMGCLISMATIVTSAETRKAGLWELTTTMTWQRSPSAQGLPVKAGTHTSQVCLTQEMIDKYGALLPQSKGQCSVVNRVMTPQGETADYVCSGKMSGKGTLESSWSDAEHSHGKLHLVGTLEVGSMRKPIEWTNESSSVFKSSNCGNVVPQALPTRGN